MVNKITINKTLIWTKLLKVKSVMYQSGEVHG